MNINGENYTLVFNYNAMCEIEEILGKSIIELMEDRSQVGLKALRAMLCAGLLEKHGLTIQETGKLIDNYLKVEGNFGKLYEIVLKALKNSGIAGDKKNQSTGPREKKSLNL
jgi:hypothetical protein